MTPKIKYLAKQLVSCVYVIEITEDDNRKEVLYHDFAILMKELADLNVAIIPPSASNPRYQFIWGNDVLSLNPAGLELTPDSNRYS